MVAVGAEEIPSYDTLLADFARVINHSYSARFPQITCNRSLMKNLGLKPTRDL
jgi:hypothetical protein